MIQMSIQMIRDHFADMMAEVGLIDWNPPDVLEGYADEQMELPVFGANCIKVWFAGSEQIRVFQTASAIYDYRGGIGILYAFATVKPNMGEVKRKIGEALRKIIHRHWPHYLGREGVFSINTDIDYRYSSNMGGGGSRQSLISAPKAPGNTIETLCVMLSVDYRVSDDVSLY